LINSIMGNQLRKQRMQLKLKLTLNLEEVPILVELLFHLMIPKTRLQI